MERFKSPMLAVNAWDSEEGQLVTLDYPLYASPKIDGVRGVCTGGQLYTRSGKPFKNQYINSMLSDPLFDGFDGEFIIGEATDPKVFHKTSGPLRSSEGEPEFKWYIFDDYDCPDKPFIVRLEGLKWKVEKANITWNSIVEVGRKPFILVPQVLVHNDEELLEFEATCVAEGYEGVMVRKPDGLYKNGRSTLKQGWLLKVKRFAHSEAEIIGHEQEFENLNEAFINELGHQTRSGHQENKVPIDRLAAFICKSPEWPEPFRVSCTSMTHKERESAWKNILCNPDFYKGDLCRYKHFPHGAKDRPRHPLYAGLRDKDDL